MVYSCFLSSSSSCTLRWASISYSSSCRFSSFILFWNSWTRPFVEFYSWITSYLLSSSSISNSTICCKLASSLSESTIVVVYRTGYFSTADAYPSELTIYECIFFSFASLSAASVTCISKKSIFYDMRASFFVISLSFYHNYHLNSSIVNTKSLLCSAEI